MLWPTLVFFITKKKKRGLSHSFFHYGSCEPSAAPFQHYGVLVHRPWRPLSGGLQTGPLHRLASTHPYTSNHLSFRILQKYKDSDISIYLIKVTDRNIFLCSHSGCRNLLHRHHKDPKPTSAVVVTATKFTKLHISKPMAIVPEEQLEEKEGTSLIASSMMLLPMPLPCGSQLSETIYNQQ